MSVINEAVRIQRQERPRATSLKAQRLLGTSKAQQILGDLKPRRTWHRRKCDWSSLISRCKKLYKLLHIEHLVPAFVIILYTIVGGAMFMALERQPDVEQRKLIATKLREKRADAVESFDAIYAMVRNQSIANPAKLHELTIGALISYEKNRDDVTQSSFSEETIWDFWNSMYFCGTLYTTIGYGNIACNTVAGQVITMFYAIIGIPLVLTTLNDLGIFLFHTIERLMEALRYIHGCSFVPVRLKNWAYRRMGRSVEKTIHRQQAPPPGGEYYLDIPYIDSDPFDIEADGLYYSNCNGSTVEFQESDSAELPEHKTVPVPAALAVTIGWIFFCSGVFCIWETNWTYFTSVYFFVISLSTIGLGDVVPDHPKLMIIMFGLVIIGLSLVSMSITVVQSKIEDLYFLLLLRLLEKYQKRLEELGAVEATMGMMDDFSNSNASKLLKFLPKGKMDSAMDRFQEEAKSQGISVPPVLQQTDRKTGLPSVLAVDKGSSDDEEFKQQVQDAIDRAEEAVQVTAPIDEAPEELMSATCEQKVQTDHIFIRTRSSQTPSAVTESSGVQSDYSSLYLGEDFTQTGVVEIAETEVQSEAPPQHDTESQTPKTPTSDVDVQSSVPTDSTAAQSQLSWFDLSEGHSQTEPRYQQETETQTPEPIKPTLADCESQTVSSRRDNTFAQTAPIISSDVETQAYVYDLREDESQTTTIRHIHSESQTDVAKTAQKKLQTHLYDARNDSSQTLALPAMRDESEQTTSTELDDQESQTEVPYPERKTSDASRFDKIRKSFQRKERSLSTPLVKITKANSKRLQQLENTIDESCEDEEEEEIEAEDEEEPTSDESLRWDPIDGMHAEKQRRVTSLRQMFESGQTLDVRQSDPKLRRPSRQHERRHSSISLGKR